MITHITVLIMKNQLDKMRRFTPSRAWFGSDNRIIQGVYDNQLDERLAWVHK